MKLNWKKRTYCLSGSHCLSIGLVIIIILALAYSINLGIKQQEAFIEMDKSLDRIIYNVRLLEFERNKAIAEKEKMEALENKTAEEMKGAD